jgi:thioredoxin reductase (NADPH)
MTNINSKLYDVLILGGGPSGLTAAIYASRAELSTLVVAGQPSGGQLMLTSEVENFPGFVNGIMGPQLVQNFRDQAAKFGTEFAEENVTGISGSPEENFTVTTDAGNTFVGRAIILAMGASAKWLELESEQRLIGRGVSACATCDAFFFKEKVVAVVGGGDAALEEATYLTKFACKVYVLIRGTKDAMKASKYMQQRALSEPKIEFIFNTEVVEVLGDKKVAGLKVINNQTGETNVMDDVEGLFVAIGHKPNTEFLKGFIDLGKFGYVVVHDGTKTSKEGVFVAGDVSDFRYRQAITASGLGAMAALDAEKFLAEKTVSVPSDNC